MCIIHHSNRETNAKSFLISTFRIEPDCKSKHHCLTKHLFCRAEKDVEIITVILKGVRNFLPLSYVVAVTQSLTFPSITIDESVHRLAICVDKSEQPMKVPIRRRNNENHTFGKTLFILTNLVGLKRFLAIYSSYLKLPLNFLHHNFFDFSFRQINRFI